MTGIVGQDPRGRSGVLNQLSGLGIGKKVEDWETDPGGPYTPLQIGQGAALAGHGTAETNSQLSLSNNAYYDRVNNRWQYIGASEANKINFNDDGIMYFQSASAGSADGAITWSDRLTINNAGDIYSTAFTAYQDSASITGFSTTPTNDMIQYKRVGFLVYFWFYIYGPSHPTGSSGAGISFRFSLPYAASSVTDYQVRGNLDWSYDNSAIDTSVNSFWRIVGGESTIKLFKNDVEDGWTNAGNKGAVGSGVYQANSI